MSDSYRKQFEDQSRAAYYDAVQYGPDSYGQVLWQIEMGQLEKVVASMNSSPSDMSYLDFATGTGRIIEFMENKVGSSRGIEISEAMAAEARKRVSRSQILCMDITDPSASVEGKYDLITAFRFFLNAEPSLRLAAIKALSQRLRDDHSLLVFNNHGSLMSLKGIGRAFQRRRFRSEDWETSGNVMSHHEALNLIEAAGLKVVSVMGCGVLTARLSGLIGHVSPALAKNLELRLSRFPLAARFGVNRTYVTKLDR
jgi:hypothetical protein